MKHISESIIGRKGISRSIGSILQQGDIVIIQSGDIYMVLKDQNCLKQILSPDVFRSYDMSKGACVRSTGRDYVGFMNLSSFDDKLENINGNGYYNIVQIWRDYRKRDTITSSDDINQIIQIENLKLLKESYKLIWKR